MEIKNTVKTFTVFFFLNSFPIKTFFNWIDNQYPMRHIDNTEECCIYLCNFVVGDQLASNYSCKHVYHRWCITRALAWALTYPFCWDVDSDGDYWVWHPDDGVRILSFGFFFFFFCYSFLCRLTIMTMLIYIVA